MHKCKIEGCFNKGNWISGFCATCRQYLHRVEQRSMAWRLARIEQVRRWETRLELAVSKKGTITHIRSNRSGS